MAYQPNLNSIIKAEDSPSASGDKGIPVFAIRQLTDAVSTDTDGDYTLLKLDEEGRLKVASKPPSFTLCQGALTLTTASAASLVGGSDVATAAGYLSVNVSRASNVVLHVKNTGTVAQTAGAFTFEGSVDSTTGTDGTWFTIQVVRSNANTIETSSGTLSLAVGAGLAYSYEASVNAYNWVRVRVTTNITTGAADTWTIIRGSYATEPVPAIQTHSVSGSVTSNIGTSGLTVYTDSATSLAASAAFTGTSRDGGTTPAYNIFVANAYSDQAGTLYVQKSTDATTWRNAGSVAVTAGNGFSLEIRVTARYYRVYYVNGSTAQTAFLLTSAYQRI